MNKFIFLILLILTLGCKEKLTLAKEVQREIEPASNSVFIIDASASMLSIEFKPNRLERIKKMVDAIINSKKENDYISIIVYSKNSMVVSPLTNDRNKLLAGLKNVNEKTYEKLGDGTSFNGAFQKGIEVLGKVKSKSIFLFTDGTYNEVDSKKENRVPIETLQEKSLKTNVLILAKDDLYNPPVNKDKNGNLLFVELKSPKVDTIFSQLAQKTKGAFKRIYNNNELNEFNIVSFYNNNKS